MKTQKAHEDAEVFQESKADFAALRSWLLKLLRGLQQISEVSGRA
jgi:hypothetical protein